MQIVCKINTLILLFWVLDSKVWLWILKPWLLLCHPLAFAHASFVSLHVMTLRVSHLLHFQVARRSVNLPAIFLEFRRIMFRLRHTVRCPVCALETALISYGLGSKGHWRKLQFIYAIAHISSQVPFKKEAVQYLIKNHVFWLTEHHGITVPHGALRTWSTVYTFQKNISAWGIFKER